MKRMTNFDKQLKKYLSKEKTKREIYAYVDKYFGKHFRILANDTLNEWIEKRKVRKLLNGSVCKFEWMN